MNIQENKERFESLLLNEPILSNLAGTKDIINYLSESDFYIAPASKDNHGNYEGGLCEHCLQVYDNIIAIAPIFKQEYTNATLTFVSLFHDICKIGIYQKEKRNRKKKDDNGNDILDNRGKAIWEELEVYAINDLLPLGHGEKSVIILQRYYTLSIEQIMAIRWHMGGYDDITKSYIGNLQANAAFNKYPLITLLHISDLTSIFLQLNKQKENIDLDFIVFETKEDLQREMF